MRLVTNCKLLLFGCLMLGGCHLSQTSESASTNGIPRLVVHERTHDFGEISEGDEVGVVFWLNNEGNAPLIITKAKAGCGCTSVQCPQSPIAPGDSAKLDVLFDTKNRSGRQSKQVLVYSNATQEPMELLFTAFIKSNSQ